MQVFRAIAHLSSIMHRLSSSLNIYNAINLRAYRTSPVLSEARPANELTPEPKWELAKELYNVKIRKTI